MTQARPTHSTCFSSSSRTRCLCLVCLKVNRLIASTLEQIPVRFVGRLPVVATLTELDADALIRILTEPKNSLTKQYTKLFEMEDVEVDFREDALRAVADKAMERKTGARGLRSILEAVLLNTMYDLPSSESVSKVVIDESVIKGESDPMVIYENVDQAKAAPEE